MSLMYKLMVLEDEKFFEESLSIYHLLFLFCTERCETDSLLKKKDVYLSIYFHNADRQGFIIGVL